jgi:hypothetical protein
MGLQAAGNANGLGTEAPEPLRHFEDSSLRLFDKKSFAVFDKERPGTHDNKAASSKLLLPSDSIDKDGGN